jgi:hypothetical protein
MLLFGLSTVLEGFVLFGSSRVYSMSEATVIAAVLLIVPSFVVGYLARQLGIVYGLMLGVMPAIFAIAQLPTEVLGFSQIAGAVVLFAAYVLVSGASGAGGTALARWRDAA